MHKKKNKHTEKKVGSVNTPSASIDTATANPLPPISPGFVTQSSNQSVKINDSPAHTPREKSDVFEEEIVEQESEDGSVIKKDVQNY